jgi:hypothetical protein
MNRIAKQTAFYRGYLADNRSLVPLTVLLAAAVPIWLLVYLIGTPADARHDSGPAYSGTEIFIRDHQAAGSLVRDAAPHPRFPIRLCGDGKLKTHHAAS